jgi:hypothetical protein
MRYLLILLFAVRVAAEVQSLDPQLEPFRPLLGKTWRGEFKGTDAPTVDVSRWERALNGKAVRILHSINDGVYGGESIVRWDTDRKEITYYYFTTAGFFTTGTMTCTNSRLIALEKVVGSTNTTAVRSTYEIRADGTLASKAEYLKGSQVTGTREVVYKEVPGAEVRFR